MTQVLCSAFRTINPVYSVLILLCYSEVTNTDFYFHLKHFGLLKYIVKRYQKLIWYSSEVGGVTHWHAVNPLWQNVVESILDNALSV